MNNKVEKMTVMSDNGIGSQRLPHSANGSSMALPDDGSSGMPTTPEVEYSVTCQRRKINDEPAGGCGDVGERGVDRRR